MGVEPPQRDGEDEDEDGDQGDHRHHRDEDSQEDIRPERVQIKDVRRLSLCEMSLILTVAYPVKCCM